MVDEVLSNVDLQNQTEYQANTSNLVVRVIQIVPDYNSSITEQISFTANVMPSVS